MPVRNLSPVLPRRRDVLGLMALTLVGGGLSMHPAMADIALKDVTGREVTLAKPASRIVIGDGRFLLALALVHPDPVSLVAGWPRDINRLGRSAYEAWQKKFPAINDIPQTSAANAAISVERIIAAKPDLALFSLGATPSDEERARLEAAGIPVAVVDFFVKPLDNMEASLRLIGAAVGREAQAEAFIAFRRQHFDVVRSRVATLPPEKKPRLFFEAHAAMTADCCNSPGRGNIGEVIAAVGATNIGASVISGAFGKLNLEYVIAQDPQVYVATGGSHMEGTAGLLIGPEYSAERARETLAGLIKRPGFDGMSAVRNHRVYGLAHQMLNSPLDVLTLEVLARWAHPELFADLDPDATLAEINARFLAVPVAGPNWIALD
ncbi:ABC transporter substrate-binding protein [Ancylobacter sp. Lp-2]|uniref:ABC transporter substrate-binding protein n=1 Tax=Ancylobacter sp. Lp-2 TaxID=2881339 RepID=UPI001E486241|nr:ABC transporter substrate-binding protein [Ancylobacter sp. Lp-2]MCB4771669.1 ABC transporter substrate-binding protein [Ancylobacter sp. Lp-2]